MNESTTEETIIVPLYNKDNTLKLDDAINYYAKKLYPNQLIPKVYLNKKDVENDNDHTGLKIVLEHEQITKEGDKEGVFDINKYFSNLSTTQFGKNIIHSKLISSTQIVMSKFLSGANQGLVMVADRQTNGIGRGNNDWKSPLGCLLTSFKCKQSVENGSKIPFIQYIVGIAMVEAINSFPIASDLNVRLKWPNDIYGSCDSNWKLGGVLCQSSFVNNEFDIIVGLGINVTNTNNPSTTLNQMIHKKQVGKEDGEKEIVNNVPVYISREQLLSQFFNVFEPMYITFTKEGFKPLEKRYIDNWMHSNQVVKLKEKQGQFVKITGLTDYGYLKAIDCDEKGNSQSTNAESHELHPDGTSFDINNLILMKKQQS